VVTLALQGDCCGRRECGFRSLSSFASCSPVVPFWRRKMWVGYTAIRTCAVVLTTTLVILNEHWPVAFVAVVTAAARILSSSMASATAGITPRLLAADVCFSANVAIVSSDLLLLHGKGGSLRKSSSERRQVCPNIRSSLAADQQLSRHCC
jgi:hypothetical protein